MGKRGNAVGEDGMPDLEVKSVNLLGTPVSYAYAVKAGPWMFLTGHEAFDFAAGIPDEVAGPPGFPLFGRPRSRRGRRLGRHRRRRGVAGSAARAAAARRRPPPRPAGAG